LLLPKWLWYILYVYDESFGEGITPVANREKKVYYIAYEEKNNWWYDSDNFDSVKYTIFYFT